MENLVSMTVFAIGLAILTSFPAGAVATALVAGTVLLGLTVTVLSGAMLGLVHARDRD